MNRLVAFFMRLAVLLTSRTNRARYDDEILKKEWKTKDGAAWVWKQVALGRRIAIVRWEWKRLKWFRVAFIIGPYRGGDGPVGPRDNTPTRRHRVPVAA